MAKSKARPKKAAVATTVETPEQRAFLANIIASPEDKKARLVYADLLQQTDDPRGAFIVMQCTRAELADGDPRIPDLDAQIAALLAKHKKAWTAFGDNKGARWEFRRGFAEKLSIDAKDLLANGEKILAAEPIEELSVWKIDESPTMTNDSRLAPVLALPLHRIRRLSLARCELTAEDYAAIARATTLGNVEVLDLTKATGDTSPIAPLADATLPRLRELIVRGCHMGDDAMRALARSQTLRFTRFVAAANDLTAASCEEIANAAWAPLVEHLDLSSNEDLRDDGVRALAASTKLTALRSLVLSYVGMHEAAPDIILSSPVFARLDHLDITTNLSREEYDRVKAVFGDRLR